MDTGVSTFSACSRAFGGRKLPRRRAGAVGWRVISGIIVVAAAAPAEIPGISPAGCRRGGGIRRDSPGAPAHVRDRRRGSRLDRHRRGRRRCPIGSTGSSSPGDIGGEEKGEASAADRTAKSAKRVAAVLALLCPARADRVRAWSSDSLTATRPQESAGAGGPFAEGFAPNCFLRPAISAARGIGAAERLADAGYSAAGFLLRVAGRKFAPGAAERHLAARRSPR